jgi:SAM-dependent methyltransferase
VTVGVGRFVRDRIGRGGRQSHAVKLLPPSTVNRLLEIGCADGGFLPMLESRAHEVFGVEPDVDVLRKAAPRRSVAAIGEELPFRTASFDVVLLLDVLEHVGDERRVVAEIARVLKPGGVTIVSTPHRGLFGWLDLLNIKIRWPRLYVMLGRLTGSKGHYLEQFRALQKIPETVDDVAVLRRYASRIEHRHYSVGDLRTLLHEFDVEEVRRTGLVVFPLAHLAAAFLERVCRLRGGWLMRVAVFEDSYNFGAAGYNVALRARRRPTAVVRHEAQR